MARSAALPLRSVAERHLLVVVVDGRVIGARGVDRAVGQARSKRRAVARAAQRRHEIRERIEPADVDVAQVQVMHVDVTGQRQAFGFGGTNHVHAARRRDAAKVHADARLAHEREDRGERDRFCRHRDSGQPEARCDLAVVRDAAACEVRILRPQPDAVPERARVLQRTEQHLRVGQRDVGARSGSWSPAIVPSAT